MFDPLDHITCQEDLKALGGIARLCSLGSDWMKRDTVALEVGSWAGSSALVLNQQFDQVFCVDTWQGTPSDRLGAIAHLHGQAHIFATFCSNMGDRLHRAVFPCVGTSAMWAKVWTRPLDLVFIDADHEYASVSRDILMWKQHVRPAGVICGHDYGSFSGVTKAVDEIFPDRKLAGLSLWYMEIPK